MYVLVDIVKNFAYLRFVRILIKGKWWIYNTTITITQYPLIWGWAQCVKLTSMWGGVVQLLYRWSVGIKVTGKCYLYFRFVLQVHNRGTTPPHMGVGPTHWNPPPCKGMLCPCCVPEVQITSPKVTRFTISY